MIPVKIRKASFMKMRVVIADVLEVLPESTSGGGQKLPTGLADLFPSCDCASDHRGADPRTCEKSENRE